MDSLLKRGAFVVSIDTELDEGSSRYQRCQKVTRDLLALMETYDIRATWAVMGYMLLDGNAESGPAAALDWLKKTDNNEVSDELRSQLKNGREVISQIMACKAPQEIGCHTFSHIRAGDPACTTQQFEAELEACQVFARRLGIALRSFVYPWNSVGHLDSLARYGYTNYRGPTADWFANLPATLRRPIHLIHHWLPMAPPMAVPTGDGRFWNLPGSYYYACGSGWGNMIPVSLRVNKARMGLRIAARKRSLFHLWFHPFDIADNAEMWLDGLESIFAQVWRYREEGKLDNLTMAEVSQELTLATADNTQTEKQCQAVSA